ncbi:hypothetical protein A6R68_03175 [Neotoma lepida]|uniref:Uncharacterized protein n=1 Tax=Neotoma lepida TaxID=56216 RepID=A0A1A6GQ12_NEOLE|nr:hypothetical protein A6R68_03175 [Neotoma lepida]
MGSRTTNGHRENNTSEWGCPQALYFRRKTGCEWVGAGERAVLRGRWQR